MIRSFDWKLAYQRAQASLNQLQRVIAAAEQRLAGETSPAEAVGGIVPIAGATYRLVAMPVRCSDPLNWATFLYD